MALHCLDGDAPDQVSPPAIGVGWAEGTDRADEAHPLPGQRVVELSGNAAVGRGGHPAAVVADGDDDAGRAGHRR